MIRDFYCPQCLDREWLGAECSCGLLWSKSRRTMAHYAVLLDAQLAEEKRQNLTRRQTLERNLPTLSDAQVDANWSRFEWTDYLIKSLAYDDERQAPDPQKFKIAVEVLGIDESKAAIGPYAFKEPFASWFRNLEYASARRA